MIPVAPPSCLSFDELPHARGGPVSAGRLRELVNTRRRQIGILCNRNARAQRLFRSRRNLSGLRSST